MIRAILMDFNGVIINDEPIQMKAYQEIFKSEGIEMSEEEYYACGGMDDATFLRHHYNRAEKELTDEKIIELRTRKTAAWRKIIDDEVPLFPGVENFIKKCSHRFAMGVVSMANRADISYILEKTNLRDSFTTIVSADDVAACKPDPQAYIEGFRQLDQARLAQGHYPLLRKECLVIEDVPQGVQAGKAAGMQVLAVTNTFDAGALRAANADWVTESLNDWMPESLVRAFSKTI